MAIESITNQYYRIFSETIVSILMIIMGIVGFFLCYPGIAHDEYASITVAVACLYMLYESADEFFDQVSSYKLHESNGENATVPRNIQIVSLCIALGVMVFFIIILASEEAHDVTVVVEVVIMIIIGVLKCTETGMEIALMSSAANYVRLMFRVQQDHLISLIRDAYRLFLSRDEPSREEKQMALALLHNMRELPAMTLRNLRYEQRIGMISAILTDRVAGDEFNGTDASIWAQFQMQFSATQTQAINQSIPQEMRALLDSPCPISGDGRLVRQTHVWCFVPASISLANGAGAAALGDLCKNFIPGIGVIWRYQPCDEQEQVVNNSDRWVVMYKGADGVVPETLGTGWDESLAILQRINDSNDGKQGHGYDTMTLLEVIASTYCHFVQTGSRMYPEKFTRVKEQTESEQYGIHHLFIGRFNLSGLNNDAYLDVGGNESQFHTRGLSVCRRFEVDLGKGRTTTIPKVEK